jgi:DNA-binding NarL/FixJ family response regulator
MLKTAKLGHILSSAMRSFKVLVVDDFEAFREYVSFILQETAQFQVVGQASDGFEAVQKAREHQPDLILLDIGLPNLNGIEALKRISLAAPRSRILFLSHYEDQAVVSSALSGSSYGYILKSDASRELLPALASVLRGQIYVSSGLASATA